MCIVIDVNVLPLVFDQNNAQHENFSPVNNWIFSNKGYLVYGGNSYRKELEKMPRYMRLIRYLREDGKAIHVKDNEVDKVEVFISGKINKTDCDDPHIMAILAASKCCLLCSCDLRSFEFIKNKKLYPKGTPKIKIYTSKKNVSLLRKSDPSTLTNIQ